MSDSVPPTPQDTANLSVNTGGGAFIHGNVNTGDDAFIGRDQIAVTINNIVQGINDLPTRYDGVVRNFLEYYLGSAAQPAPFGGRDDALAMLDRWLIDPQSPHYALLAAPAGRGKSSLLAHWVSHLAPREDIHVVYFPISIRFNSNRDNVVFAALAARIAHVYGEKMTRANDAQEYRGVFVDYLRRPPPDGKPLLVVLDGLDEAAGWEVGADLFPLIPPGHLRVVVAARVLANDPQGQGWLTQLGWEKPGVAQILALSGLNRNGVANVLEKMGDPLDQLASQVDVVTQLHKLSEGDPLLVRLYVEALLPYGNQAATLRPNDLLTLQPGLKAYFDQWFKGQEALWKNAGAIFERRGVNALLDLCSTALGPLSKEDVLALAPDYFEDSHSLEAVVIAVNRFVIGDGTDERSYVFSHPRLRDYFADRLTSTELKDWQERFLYYGKEALIALQDKKLKPDGVSHYIIRYYGVHLSAANVPVSDLYSMMCEEWLRAWEWVDGTPDGFLGDIRRIWATAEREGPTALGRQVGAALCFSSVTSISANISTELLIACMKVGVITPSLALVMARAKPDMQERIQCLIAVSDHLVLDLKQIVLLEALTLACSIRNEENRAKVLWSIAVCLPKEANELIDKTLMAARSMDNRESRVNVLSALAVRLPLNQRCIVLAEALTVARHITNEAYQANALGTIVAHLPVEANKLLDEILTVTRSIQNEWNRAKVLSALVTCQHVGQTDAILAEALTTARSIMSAKRRAKALSTLATRLPAEKQDAVLAEALKAARSIGSQGIRANTLSVLAAYFPPEQQNAILAEALSTIRRIPDEQERAKALSTLVACIPSEAIQLLGETLAIARSIQNERSRISTLSVIAARFPAELRDPLLVEVLSIIRNIKDEKSKVNTLCIVASLLPIKEQRDLLAEALSTIRSIADLRNRAKALRITAAHLPTEEQKNVLTEALEAARNIVNEGSRANALSAVAARLPLGTSNLLDEILAAARSIVDERSRANALSAIAAHLPPEEQRSIFVEALTAARSIVDERSRANALSAIAIHLLAEEQRIILVEALTTARNIVDERSRADVFSAIAIHLPAEERRNILAEALEAARNIANEGGRANALSVVATRLPLDATNLLTETLATARNLRDPLGRANVLSAVTARLPLEKQRDVLTEAIAAVHSIEDERSRANALSAIAARLPLDATDILDETLAAARSIGNPWKRANILSAIAARLPPEAPNIQLGLLSDVIASVHVLGSATLLKPLAEQWEVVCQANNISAVAEIIKLLHAFASAKRENLLNAIAALMPVIARLGGERAVRETAQAIIDTAKWWP